MNKFFNSWIFILGVLAFPFAIAVGWNENFQFFGFTIPGEEFEYGNTIFLTVALLLGFLGGFKSYRKWMGLFIIKQEKKFIFTSPISKERKSRVGLYNYLEIIFLLLFTLFYLNFITTVTWLAVAFMLITLEHIISTVVGLHLNNYGVGITNKAIVRADREVDAIYFKGLSRITQQQDQLLFEYSTGLVLEIPLSVIPKKRKAEFLKTLQVKAPKEKVFYSGFDQL